MRNLKLIGLSILLLVSTTNIAFCSDNMYNQQIKYYSNMKTCTKGTFLLWHSNLKLGTQKVDVGMTYYIYGVQNGKCHIREHLGSSDMHCYLPMNTAKKYASEGIQMINASVKNGSAYSPYINQIDNDDNYCKYKY